MSREQVESAVREIRREGLKAAVLHSLVESTVVFFVALTALSIAGFDYTVAGYGLLYPVSVSVAAAFLVTDTLLLYRKRTVEYFEEINPDVREKLRTARDAADSGESAPAAEALYDEVLEDLKQTSSHGFISGLRLAAALVSVLVIGAALMAGGAADVSPGEFARDSLGFGAPADGDTSAVDASENEYTGVQSGEHLVGEPSEFNETDEELLIRLRGGGSPSPGGTAGGGDSYYSDDFDGVDVDSAGAVEYYTGGSAGLSTGDREVVKEYFLRKREGG